MIKRLLFAVLSFSLLFFNVACSNSSSSGKNPIDGTYYCERVTLSDENGNFQTFYSSSNLGSENTYLTISDGEKVEYRWYYHGEANDVLVGSIRDLNEKEGINSGDVYFEGSGDKYTLSYSLDDETGKIKSLVLVLPPQEDGSILGLSLSKEKQESSSGEYEDIAGADDKLADFESSDVYKKIEEAITKSYSTSDYTLKYDSNKKELVLTVKIEGLSGALGQSSELDNTWNTLCGQFDKNSKAFQTVINTGGYKGISFVLSAKDGNTELYTSRNGERAYVYQPSGNSSASNSSSSSGSSSSSSSSGSSNSNSSSSSSSSSSSFEQSAIYKEISRTVKSSFSDRNPKVKYNQKDNMLTVTLTAGKGWKEAILNDSSSYAAWIDYTNDLLNVSESGYASLCDAGYSDIAFTILVQDYDDSSKALFGCMNGTSYYDFTIN